MRNAFSVTLLLFFLASAAYARESVIQHFASASPDPAIEELLYFAGGVAVTGASFSSSRTSHEPAPATLESSLEALRDRPDVAGHDWLMAFEYQETGEALVLHIAIVDLSRDELRARHHATLPITVNLDTAIEQEVRQLIADAGLTQFTLRAGILEGVLSGAGSGSLRSTGDALGTGETGGMGRATPPTITETPQVPELPPQFPDEERRGTPLTRVSGLESSIIGSGLFLVGEASDLFRYGAGVQFSVGYSSAGESRSTSYGARGAVYRIFADRDVFGGQLYLVSLGPDLHVSTIYRDPSRVTVRVSAGPAALAVVEEGETLAKLVPYVDAGATARLPLGKRISIGGELSLLAIFEEGLPLIGIAPSLLLGVEW